MGLLLREMRRLARGGAGRSRNSGALPLLLMSNLRLLVAGGLPDPAAQLADVRPDLRAKILAADADRLPPF